MNHPTTAAIPTLLYQEGPPTCTHPSWGRCQPSVTGDTVQHRILLSSMQDLGVPYLVLHLDCITRESKFLRPVKAKRDHSIIYTGQQAQRLYCPAKDHPGLPFSPNTCPVASWPHKQEPVCCCPALNSSTPSLHLSGSGQKKPFIPATPSPYECTFTMIK